MEIKKIQITLLSELRGLVVSHNSNTLQLCLTEEHFFIDLTVWSDWHTNHKGKTERRFWAEFCLKCYPILVIHNINSISAEFGQKNSSIVPHPPFFWPHVYKFCQCSACFQPIFHLTFRSFCRVPSCRVEILLDMMICLHCIIPRIVRFMHVKKFPRHCLDWQYWEQLNCCINLYEFICNVHPYYLFWFLIFNFVWAFHSTSIIILLYVAVVDANSTTHQLLLAVSINEFSENRSFFLFFYLHQ